MHLLTFSSILVCIVLLCPSKVQAELREMDYKFKIEQTMDALRMQRDMHRVNNFSTDYSAKTRDMINLQKDRLSYMNEVIENSKRMSEQIKGSTMKMSTFNASDNHNRTRDLVSLQQNQMSLMKTMMENNKRLTEQANDFAERSSSNSSENAKYVMQQTKEKIESQRIQQQDQMRRIKQQTEDLNQRVKDMMMNNKK